METLNGKAAPLAAQEGFARRSKRSGEPYARSRQLMPGGVTSNIRYADPHPLCSFLSNAHGDAEIDAIVQGYDRSLREIRASA